jgi:adenylate kinase family enzyme
LAVKLLRVTNTTRDGFILTDFPRFTREAEMLEEYRGGMNAFVHLSLPEEIQVAVEEAKHACQDCGRQYYSESIKDIESGIYIDQFMPADGHCFDCGSRNIKRAGDVDNFEEKLSSYRVFKDELLAFYHHIGLLVDFDLKKGYDDYNKLRDKIQFKIKH